ncbi:hypothetical protein GCM10010365_25290 [Streptomyces poonensis]|uniref:Uncharacterized protein n=1 Tax=Streptomyces poonensis TaxID=68255 RepID=A0A918UGG2_9ACTN|nr:hypothetical protein GCM10010365_25290 [Streptomyces poonensis]GLJ89475.1 hypothetical protein GCM10017589_20750 [Streptomyces poonensis]
MVVVGDPQTLETGLLGHPRLFDQIRRPPFLRRQEVAVLGHWEHLRDMRPDRSPSRVTPPRERETPGNHAFGRPGQGDAEDPYVCRTRDTCAYGRFSGAPYADP